MLKHFWIGFEKRAGYGDGGSGFSGVGKGNFHSQKQQNEAMGTVDTGVQDGKDLRDRDRGPRDFGPFETGQEMEEENGSHIIY